MEDNHDNDLMMVMDPDLTSIVGSQPTFLVMMLSLCFHCLGWCYGSMGWGLH